MVAEKTLTDAETAKIKSLLSSGMTQRAVQRQTGLSRRQISKVAGIDTADENPFSEDPRKISKDEAAKAIHALSIRPRGVKNSELASILAAHFGFRRNKDTGAFELDMSDGQFSYLKKKARDIPTLTNSPLFVPEWMPRETPVIACRTLLNLAANLQDRITETVLEFCETYPDSSPARVCEELIYLAVGKAKNEPVESRCKRNMIAAIELQARQVGTPKTEDHKTPALVCDEELDVLCI